MLDDWFGLLQAFIERVLEQHENLSEQKRRNDIFQLCDRLQSAEVSAAPKPPQKRYGLFVFPLPPFVGLGDVRHLQNSTIPVPGSRPTVRCPGTSAAWSRPFCHPGHCTRPPTT